MFSPWGGTDADGRKWRRPRIDFTTTGKNSRRYTLAMIDPEVRIYDDPPTVAVSPVHVVIENLTAEPGTQFRGQIIPATFEAFQIDSPGAPIVRLTLSPYHAGGDDYPVGITHLQIGRGSAWDSVDNMIRAWSDHSGAGPMNPYVGTLHITTTDIKTIPIATLADKALAMTRVYGHVDKIYKRKPKPDEYATDEGTIRATVIGFDHDEHGPPPRRGRRKRGPTTGHQAVWHDDSVLTIAAECKGHGMSRAETVAHFLAAHGQSWSEDSVKKMWGRCREIGLLPTIERGTK